MAIIASGFLTESILPVLLSSSRTTPIFCGASAVCYASTGSSAASRQVRGPASSA